MAIKQGFTGFSYVILSCSRFFLVALEGPIYQGGARLEEVTCEYSRLSSGSSSLGMYGEKQCGTAEFAGEREKERPTTPMWQLQVIDLAVYFLKWPQLVY